MFAMIIRIFVKIKLRYFIMTPKVFQSFKLLRGLREMIVNSYILCKTACEEKVVLWIHLKHEL